MVKKAEYVKDDNGIYHILGNGLFPHKCDPLDHFHHTCCRICSTFKEIYQDLSEPKNVCEVCKIEFDKNLTIVSMKAEFVTDGDWECKRRRTIRAEMNAEKIIKAKSFSEAVEYFKSQVPYIDNIDYFEYFYIDGKRYDDNFWSR